jgi:hypothetical protein
MCVVIYLQLGALNLNTVSFIRELLLCNKKERARSTSSLLMPFVLLNLAELYRWDGIVL